MNAWRPKVKPPRAQRGPGTVSCVCGWSAPARDWRQGDALARVHRRKGCPSYPREAVKPAE